MSFTEQSKQLVSQMTLEEKASLCSGKDFWHLKGLERLGLLPVMITDGPHGLRKQEGAGDHLGLNKSVAATCFPTAAATACSFDRDLLREIGAALAEECKQEQVSVLLGPGANCKRSPLCGRNFEYISEDPFVTGELAAAWIEGLQSQGIGASVKHFAANNQEARRMTISAVVDERALREIYLTGFEKAVKQAKPWTVMCAYNQINGVYMSENKRLLHDILREEWGFEGLIVTDWGAANDRVDGVKAGQDLEMPGPAEMNETKLVKAVREGILDETALDEVVTRIVALILQAQANQSVNFQYDEDAHHSLARCAAVQSTVLLKNEDAILPLQADAELAVIGAFCKKPRYQGAGSSKINPTCLDTAFYELDASGFDVDYAEGFPISSWKDADIPGLLAEACRVAQGKQTVLIFAGLPQAYESEGFDRKTMQLPKEQNALISAVAKVNPNVIVVLQCGSPVCMPWKDEVKGIVLSYLGGQAGGTACVDILLGRENPSGKLAESFPLAQEDVPCHRYFPGGNKTVEYRESIFVGYRYYDTAQRVVAFPFGFGLSYTTFAYSDLRLERNRFVPGEMLNVTFTLQNTGKVSGAEAAQVYVGLPCAQSRIPRAEKELKGFAKVFLAPGEKKEVSIQLDTRSFAYYNTAAACWAVEGGSYDIHVAASSRDIRLTAQIKVEGDGKEVQLPQLGKVSLVYNCLPCAGELTVSDEDFYAVYPHPLPNSDRGKGEKFTLNSTLFDMKDTIIGKQLEGAIRGQASKMMEGSEEAQEMAEAMIMDMPLRAMIMISQGQVGYDMLESMLDMLNGNMLKGLAGLMKKRKKDES